MSSSDSTNPVPGTGTPAVSDVQTPAALSQPIENQSSKATPENQGKGPELSLRDKIMAKQKESATPADPKALPDPNKSADAKVVPATPATPEPPAFAANFKYKAFGKEKEIDEFLRPLIKDADSEKKVKDILTRAEAFDDLKARNEGTRNQFQTLLQDHQALDKDVSRVMKFRNNKDYDNFFRELRIPDNEIFDWVQRKIDVMNLPPEQRQAMEQQAELRSRNLQHEEQQNSYKSQVEQQAVTMRQMQLDMALNKPDISRTASAWDSKTGEEGSFRDLVITEASQYELATGKDMTVDEAVQSVLKKFGKMVAESQTPSQPAPVAPEQAAQATPQFQAPAPQAPQAKPVIPVVAAGPQSPVKKQFKSLEEIRAHAKTL